MDEAEKLLEQACTAENKFSWFGGTSKYNTAGDLYNQAGNKFMAKNIWQKAGEAYNMAAESYGKAGVEYEVEFNYAAAARAWKQVNLEGACEMYMKARNVAETRGDFRRAAKYLEEIAAITEKKNPKDAIPHMNELVDYYNREDNAVSANKYLQKIAMIYIIQQQYSEAAIIFERMARNSIEHSILRWKAADYCFHAVLCTLATGDWPSAKIKLNEYSEQDYRFTTNPKHEFLTHLIDICAQGDIPRYNSLVTKTIVSLEMWHNTILMIIKDIIKNQSDSIL